jgi:hypothetical protein
MLRPSMKLIGSIIRANRDFFGRSRISRHIFHMEFFTFGRPVLAYTRVEPKFQPGHENLLCNSHCRLRTKCFRNNDFAVCSGPPQSGGPAESEELAVVRRSRRHPRIQDTAPMECKSDVTSRVVKYPIRNAEESEWGNLLSSDDRESV